MGFLQAVKIVDPGNSFQFPLPLLQIPTLQGSWRPFPHHSQGCFVGGGATCHSRTTVQNYAAPTPPFVCCNLMISQKSTHSIRDSQLGHFVHPPPPPQGTFVNVTTGGLPLASSRQRPGMLMDTLPGTGQSPLQQRPIMSKTLVVPRQRNSALSSQILVINIIM